MTLLLDRTAELGILRAHEFDEDGVRMTSVPKALRPPPAGLPGGGLNM
jgi:hypothetical protein